MAYKSNIRIIVLLVAALVLVSCARTSLDSTDRRLTDAEVCQHFKASLSELELTWPIASQPVNASQLSGLQEVISEASPRASDDMQVILAAWANGVEIATPYLVKQDLDGFTDNVPTTVQDEIHLSSVLLFNTCQFQESCLKK